MTTSPSPQVPTLPATLRYRYEITDTINGHECEQDPRHSVIRYAVYVQRAPRQRWLLAGWVTGSRRYEMYKGFTGPFGHWQALHAHPGSLDHWTPSNRTRKGAVEAGFLAWRALERDRLAAVAA